MCCKTEFEEFDSVPFYACLNVDRSVNMTALTVGSFQGYNFSSNEFIINSDNPVLITKIQSAFTLIGSSPQRLILQDYYFNIEFKNLDGSFIKSSPKMIPNLVNDVQSPDFQKVMLTRYSYKIDCHIICSRIGFNGNFYGQVNVNSGTQLTNGYLVIEYRTKKKQIF